MVLANEAAKLCPRESPSIEEARALLRKGAYLDSASVLKDILGPEFVRTVVMQFDTVRSPSLAHQILMQLPFRAIVTTNYDLLLERACMPGQVVPSWYWSDTSLASRIRESRQFILKLHGDIQCPETIVLAREDYSRCVNAAETRQALKILLGANVPFFIGYGHRDPDLDTFLDSQREEIGLDGGFALVGGEDIARDTRLRKANIFAVHLPAHSDVPAFLLHLAAAIGLDLRLCLTFVADVAWTTVEAAERLGQQFAAAIAECLGCSVSTKGVRPGSVVIVIELSGLAAVDVLQRIRRHDSEFSSILQRFHILRFAEPDVVPELSIRVADAALGAAVDRPQAARSAPANPVPRLTSDHPKGVVGKQGSDQVPRVLPAAQTRWLAAAAGTLLAGLGGLVALLSWLRPPPLSCVPGEIRDCRVTGACLSRGSQLCVSDGRRWSDCACPAMHNCSIAVVEPKVGAIVTERFLIRVTAEASCELDSVWTVIHPLKSNHYLTQVRMTRSGTDWSGYANIDQHDVDGIDLLELSAFGNPQQPLVEGDVLSTWPKAGVASEIVKLTRKPVASSAPAPTRASPCVGPIKLVATKLPSENKARVSISPIVPNANYVVHVKAPNGQEYAEPLSGGAGTVRLGDAVSKGEFFVYVSTQPMEACGSQRSNVVPIRLEKPD